MYEVIMYVSLGVSHLAISSQCIYMYMRLVLTHAVHPIHPKLQF